MSKNDIRKTRHALINGKAKYARLFIRFKTPEETLTYKPIEDGEDFAGRLSVISNWYDNFVKDKNVLLKFEVMECNEEGEEIKEYQKDAKIKNKFELTDDEVKIAERLFIVAKKWSEFVYEDEVNKGRSHEANLSLTLVKCADMLLNRIKEYQDEKRIDN